MKSTSFFTLAITALAVQALPGLRREATVIDDTVVLNFALTLEHLENAFYKTSLAKFDQAAFAHAGLPPFARGRFEQIGADEAAHVELLTKVLGDQATQPCEYNFPITDPKSFAALSEALEGVGVSAYAGAARLITDKDLLTAAATILSTEARHAAWIASAVNKANFVGGPFDVALDLNEVFTLAAAFITSCPTTNPVLPVNAFPALKITAPSLKPGSQGTVTFDNSSSVSAPTFLAFLSSKGAPTFVPVSGGKFTVPTLFGTVYALLTTNGTAVTDDVILAGPAILRFAFDSRGKLIDHGAR